MILVKDKSDILGTFTSILCLIHCLATPFIFIAQAGALNCCDTTPIWWKNMDYVFLIISFFSVYWSTRNTNINWIKPVFWMSYLALMIVLLNEKLKWFPLAELAIFIPTISLVYLHLYNKKHCKCANDDCCVDEQ